MGVAQSSSPAKRGKRGIYHFSVSRKKGTTKSARQKKKKQVHLACNAKFLQKLHFNKIPKEGAGESRPDRLCWDSRMAGFEWLPI